MRKSQFPPVPSISELIGSGCKVAYERCGFGKLGDGLLEYAFKYAADPRKNPSSLDVGAMGSGASATSLSEQAKRLFQTAMHGKTPEERLTALRQIADSGQLVAVAMTCNYQDTAAVALERLQLNISDVIAVAFSKSPVADRAVNILKIEANDTLVDSDMREIVRLCEIDLKLHIAKLQALVGFLSQKQLKVLALAAKAPDITVLAIHNMSDSAMLAELYHSRSQNACNDIASQRLISLFNLDSEPELCQDALVVIVETTDSKNTRTRALNAIIDYNCLAYLARLHKDAGDDIFTSIIPLLENEIRIMDAKDAGALELVAAYSNISNNRVHAFNKLNDPESFYRVFHDTPYQDVKEAVITVMITQFLAKQLDDEKYLAFVAIYAKARNITDLAISDISDPLLLRQITDNAVTDYAKTKARERLTFIGGQVGS
ncbi:hypothetical protein KKG55_05665 [Candidatus Micrarchaeota archaeon]|nr:hypothetical protein [Candidatus Micrarchaeota archaeon]MBU1887202.1 hypothetical protein [Candidatus Micrarchaeota archaeon]